MIVDLVVLGTTVHTLSHIKMDVWFESFSDMLVVDVYYGKF